MQYLTTRYSYAYKCEPVETNNLINDLELNDSIICIKHKNVHKCNYDKHSKTHNKNPNLSFTFIRMKYNDVMIKITLFSYRSSRFDINYTSSTPLDIDDIIKKFNENMPVEYNVIACISSIKIDTWKITENFDVKALISSLGTYCSYNVRQSQFGPSVNLYKNRSYVNHIVILNKIISCNYSDKDKEGHAFVDELLGKIKKFVGYDDVIEKDCKDVENIFSLDDMNQMVLNISI
jgi:hypothetical protein